MKGNQKAFTYHNKFGSTYSAIANLKMYGNGNTAITLTTADSNEPIATVTVNTDLILPKDQAVIKTYSENEGIDIELIKEGILLENIGETLVGYCICPIYKVNLEYFR
ncbi:MAG TPA: hypothetical protein VHP38_02085 [Ruminiclostridium sp.]|nr:hypothetical protein [Ruminiclostridium sp.]